MQKWKQFLWLRNMSLCAVYIKANAFPFVLKNKQTLYRLPALCLHLQFERNADFKFLQVPETPIQSTEASQCHVKKFQMTAAPSSCVYREYNKLPWQRLVTNRRSIVLPRNTKQFNMPADTKHQSIVHRWVMLLLAFLNVNVDENSKLWVAVLEHTANIHRVSTPCFQFMAVECSEHITFI